MQIVSVVYRLAVAFWVGGVAIFTFVLTPIIFKAYSRDTAGQIVGVLFPAYFRWGLACGAVALISQLVLRGKNLVPVCALLVVMLTLSNHAPPPSRKRSVLSKPPRKITRNARSSPSSTPSPLSATWRSSGAGSCSSFSCKVQP
jgi:hypothetical protein